jgi:ribonuclease D
VLLVQLLKFSRIPQSLARLLADEGIAKAGVGVDGDVRKLYQDWGVQVQGAVDLSAWMQELQPGTPYLSLRKLVAAVLGADMCKKMRVTLSDWAARTLTPTQIAYAALDAWVGGECYERMLADPAYISTLPPSHAPNGGFNHHHHQ